MDAIRTAYATLELSPGASERELRRQFKRLVRQWHPDRFRDQRAQVEAATRMRQLNAAYHLIRETRRAAASSPEASASESSLVERKRDGQGLSPGAIDGIVRSIGTESPFDVLFGFVA